MAKKTAQKMQQNQKKVNTAYSPVELGEGVQKGFKAADIILDTATEKPALRTKEFEDLMKRRQERAEQGISPAVQEAMKTRTAKAMMKAEQEAGLKLGSALGGVRGAGAAAQARSLQAQGMQARAGIERDMFLAQEAAKERGETALEDTLRYDIGQRAKEAEFRAALGLGYEGLDVQRQAGAMEAQALKDAAKRAEGGGIMDTLTGLVGSAYQPLGFNPKGFIEDIFDIF